MCVGAPEIMGLVEQPRLPGGGAPYKPKPAYNATATLSRALAGFEFVERVKVFQSGHNTEDDWVLLFQRAGAAPATLLVAWTSASFGHVTRLPGGEGCYSAHDWLGRPLPDVCHDPRGLHVQLSDGPTYLLKQGEI